MVAPFAKTQRVLCSHPRTNWTALITPVVSNTVNRGDQSGRAIFNLIITRERMICMFAQHPQHTDERQLRDQRSSCFAAGCRQREVQAVSRLRLQQPRRSRPRSNVLFSILFNLLCSLYALFPVVPPSVSHLSPGRQTEAEAAHKPAESVPSPGGSCGGGFCAAFFFFLYPA